VAKQAQLVSQARIAVEKVRESGLELEGNDFVEVAALLTWRMHARGNEEGQAEVKTTSWPKVSPSWQGRYRNLVREAMDET
jgi:hypothetical protein